ncbi:hypothetical protein T492DRAFT_382355 [Pavlovales sp. CCMP2436]|nr:hypothetical protein T492DRAFT_382355 [Pavlovales sp. CCMP2436]
MLAPCTPVEPLNAAASTIHETALERQRCPAAVADAQRRGARPGSTRMPAPAARHRLHGDTRGCLSRTHGCGRTRRTCAGLVPRAARTPFGLASGSAPRASERRRRPSTASEDRVHTYPHGCSCRARARKVHQCPPRALVARPSPRGAGAPGHEREHRARSGRRAPAQSRGRRFSEVLHPCRARAAAIEPHERPRRRLRGDGSGKKEAAISEYCLVPKPWDAKYLGVKVLHFKTQRQ